MNHYDQFVEYIYGIIKLDCEGMDAIYKDHIIQMFGIYGFNALHVAGLIENCGNVGNRELFVLLDKIKK